jgi:uncharacterized membrane protein (TIGR02234 family)
VPAARNGRTVKYLVLLAILVGSGLVLLASTQDWYSLHLTTASGDTAPVVVPGSTAAPALTALSLAGLALAGALAIGGRVARVVLAVLGLLVGGCLVLSVALAIGSPVHSGITVITKQTGVAGDSSVQRLVASVDGTVWPGVALAGSILVVLAAIAVLVTGAAWPSASRRYQPVRFEQADGTQPDLDELMREGDDEDDADADGTPTSEGTGEPERKERARDRAIDNWDELSKGSDPTD